MIFTSLWWNANYYDKNAAKYLANFPDKRIKIYIATSGTEGMKNAAENLVKVFKTIPPEKLSWDYSDQPKEKHNTIFRAAKEEAIIWTLGGDK